MLLQVVLLHSIGGGGGGRGEGDGGEVEGERREERIE